MTDRPREIWCDTGLYWDYVEDWSEGSWRDNDDSGGEKYVRADRIEELEAKLAKAVELAEEAFDFNIEDAGPRAWHSINDRIEELKGQ
jgi:hypothetical protein